MGERKRSALLTCVESKNQFRDFVTSLKAEYSAKFGEFKNGNGKKLITGVSEILQEIDHKQHNGLWSNLSKLLIEALRSIRRAIDNEALAESQMIDTDDGEAVVVLEGVCILSLASVKLDEPVITKDMIQLLIVLHGSLFDLHEISATLSACICTICVEWWKKDLDRNDKLCLNVITHLLKLLLHSDKTEKLSKICQMQGCLSLFNFKKITGMENSDDQSIDKEDAFTQDVTRELRSLLLSCFSHYAMLKEKEGRKFLSGVLLLHKDLLKDAHQMVMSNIKPSCPTTKAEALGSVYFQTWRSAEQEMKEAFEDICIQDVMYRAIHAPRTKDNNLFLPLCLIVHGVVCHKGAVEVRHMITRLYNPIMWRSLKANNAMVRANAASLLLKAFPLEEEDSEKPKVAETEEFMQRQFDAMNEMLTDAYPRIRVIGILGLCDILHWYWDAIPAHVIAILTRKLFSDCAFDGAVEVRQAVFQGAIVLLDTPCAHPLLGKLLPPCLEKSFHDISEKVRIAVADVLLAVKQTSTISFWSVCPIPHLLARLEVDNKPVSKRLVKLLFRSYLPETDSKQTWVERCVNFYKRNINAARKFYMMLDESLTVQETGEFLNLIGIFIYNCVTKILQQENSPMLVLEKSAENDGGGETEQPNSPIDETILAALLDTSCILWKSLNRRLSSPKSAGYRDLVKTIMITFSRTLHICFKVAYGERSLNAILLLSSYLPSASLPVFSKSVLPKLRSLPDDAPISHYSMLIKCVCSWDWTKQFLELIRDWISEATEELSKQRGKTSRSKHEETNTKSLPSRRSTRISKAASETTKEMEQRKKRKKTVKFTGVEQDLRPVQAFKYLSCFLDLQSKCSFQALKQQECFVMLLSISSSLEKCQEEISQRMSSKSPGSMPWTNDLLVEGINSRFNLLSILHLCEKNADVNGKESESYGTKPDVTLKELSSVVNWFENIIQKHLDSTKAEMSTSILSTRPTGILSNLALSRNAFNTCLQSCVDFLSCGIQLHDKVEDTLLKFCTSDISLIEYIGCITKLMLQLHEHKSLRTQSLAEDEVITGEVVSNEKLVLIFDEFLTTLLQHARQNPDGFAQVFRQEVRLTLKVLVEEQFLLHSAHAEHSWYDVLTRKAVSAVLADLFNEVRSSTGFSSRDRVSDLPAFSSSMLPVICSTSAQCKHVCEDTILPLARDENTFSDKQRDQTLQTLAHLLYTLSKDGKNKAAAASCIAELSEVTEFEKVFANIEVHGEMVKNDEGLGKESRQEGEDSDEEAKNIQLLENPDDHNLFMNDEDFII